MLKRLRSAHPILFCILAEVLFLGTLFVTDLVFSIVYEVDCRSEQRDLKEHGPRRRRGNQKPSGLLISARVPSVGMSTRVNAVRRSGM